MDRLNRLRAQARIVLRKPEAWRVSRARRLSDKHHYLTVCAIFKNEGRFLREWMAFHRSIGAEHFYLYNNNSSDDFRSEIDSEFVTLTDWPTRDMPQKHAYWHCIHTFGRQSRWIAFIDIDEFLFSPTQQDIRPILRKHENAPAIRIDSPFFGTSGRQQIPESVPLSFTKRSATRFSTKSIVDPRYVHRIENAHEFKYFAMNQVRPPLDVLRINHYWSRSFEDLAVKVRRGDAWDGYKREMDKHLIFEATLNEIEDRSIFCRLTRSTEP